MVGAIDKNKKNMMIPKLTKTILIQLIRDKIRGKAITTKYPLQWSYKII
jgi:hypothetical protein